MLEILKLILDGAILRDAHRKGMLTRRVWLAAIAFLVVLYGVGLPGGIYCANHLQNKPALVALILFFATFLAMYFVLGFRWYFRTIATLRDAEPKDAG